MEFTGDRKAPMRSPLAKAEKKIIQAWAPRFPRTIEGYHLTLMTIPWSIGLILFGVLARYNIHWLWGSSLMLLMQWFTDSFDGALGRLRDTGIPRWGFHMDHLLDFVFMWCVPVGYCFIVSEYTAWMLMIFAFLYGATMVNAFLDYGATGEFQITQLGLGPTEVRLFFIALNTILIIIGSARLLDFIVPPALFLSVVALVVIVYQTQQRIWAIDMHEHHNRTDN